MIDALLERIQAQGQLLRDVLRSWKVTAVLLTGVLVVTAQMLQRFHLLGWQSWMVLPVIAVALAISVAHQIHKQRAAWSPALADDPVLVEDASPHLLGIDVSTKAAAYVPPGETIAPYVPREVDDRVRELLRTERFMIVIGAPGAGATRTAMEAVKAVWPKHKLIRPARSSPDCTQPLAALLGALLPLSLRHCVVWVRDIGPSVETGEITCAALESFLRRHRSVRIVATMRSLQYEQLASSADPIGAPARELLERAATAIVPTELGADELDEAERLYPDIPRTALREIAAYFADYDELDRRFSLGEEAEPAGYALARAAIDFVRCGVGRPVTERFLRKALSLYLRGRQTTSREFMRARSWAERAIGSGHALLEPTERRAGWRPANGLIERIERSAFEIPAALWRLVLEEVAMEPGELLAVGAAAAARGELNVAADAFNRAMEVGDDGHRELAAQRLALLDNSVPSTAPVTQLVRRAAHRGARQGLDLRGPIAVDTTSTPNTGLFDPRVPQVRRPLSTRLYAHETLRFCARTLVLGVLDVAGILVGLATAFAGKALLHGDSIIHILVARWPLALYDVSSAIPVLILAGAYRDDCRRAAFHRIAIALGVAAALTGVIGASRGAGLLYTTCAWISFVFAIPVCHLLRAGYDRVSQSWVRRHGLHTRALLIGTESQCTALVARLREQTGRPTTFIGYVTRSRWRQANSACLGTLATLPQVIDRYRIHRVIVADPELPVRDALDIYDRCLLARATLERVLSPIEEQVYDTEFSLDAGPTLHRIRPPMLGVDVQAVKRAFDVGLTVLLLPFALATMAIIAVLIKLDSPGRILAPSYRPGRGGLPFRMLKFRTTATAQPAERSGLAGPRVASRDEREVTRVGAVLRRFGLDELPQVFNVLRGEMSLVGPRPLPRKHYNRLTDAQRRRYLVVPGVTGPWQISGRPMHYDEMVRVDLRYMRTWSLAGDLEILLQTIPAVLRGHLDNSSTHGDP